MIKIYLKEFYLLIRKILLSPFLRLRRLRLPVVEEVKKVILLRHDRIGDMVLSTPFFRAIKEKYPSAEIIIMASCRNYEVLENNPYIDEVLIYKNIFQFAKDVRKRKIDLAVDLFYTYEFKQAFLTFISGAKYRVGFEWASRGIFFNCKGPQAKKGLTMTGQLARLGDCLDIDVRKYEPVVYVSEEENSWADGFLAAKKIPEGAMKIAVHPGGYYQSQRWPLENFLNLCEKIAEKFKAKIFIFCDEKEVTLERVEKLAIAGIELVSGLALRQFISLLDKCRLLVCNNSGPLHIATALKMPTVSIMGPTNNELWQPVGENNIVLRKDLPCSPCGKSFCSSHDCMKLITVDEVVSAVEKQIWKIKK